MELSSCEPGTGKKTPGTGKSVSQFRRGHLKQASKQVWSERSHADRCAAMKTAGPIHSASKGSGARARGALASASSTARHCVDVHLCIHGHRRHPARDYIEFDVRPIVCDAYRRRALRAIPRRSRLGGRRPSTGARRELASGDPWWFGRPRGSPFPTHTPVTARAGARARKPEHSGGITGAGPGWSGAPWVSRPRSSTSPGASITVIPGRWNVPPCPGHAHLTYERARPARRVEPLRMQVACASYTHDREHSDGWPSYPGNPNAMPLSSTSIASSPSY